MAVNSFIIKLRNWEYWPMWILYVPVFFQHLWLSVKAKSLFFFLKTNPGINGFILSDSKYETLQLVPDNYLPKTFFVNVNPGRDEVVKAIHAEGFQYPLVLKPDIGYRGLLVHKIDNEDELQKKLQRIKVNHIIQEYVDYPVEVGVFYYRYPNQKTGCIPSVTLKDFLTLKGDGIRTVEELVNLNPRAYLQLEKLKVNFASEWDKVLGKEELLLLEAIGNHNRGTKFINGNHLIDADLTRVFDSLCAKMNGFYFGRFDIRTSSIGDLKKGINFKILEVNGVGAEPTHIYDPDYKITKAWADMLYLWKVIYQIAMQNKTLGEDFPKYTEAKKRWDLYKDYKKIAFR